MALRSGFEYFGSYLYWRKENEVSQLEMRNSLTFSEQYNKINFNQPITAQSTWSKI